MSIINRIISFIAQGISTWRDASFGNYDIQSEDVIKMKDEIMSGETGPATDKANLRNDMKNVGRDLRKAYNIHIIKHEQKTNKQ